MPNSTALIALTGSTQGEPIKITATGTPGTTVHTTGTSATIVDRLYLWANNTQAAATASTVLLTIEWGAATAPDFNIIVPIPGQAGLVQVIDGLPLLGNGSVALTVKAFAATTAVINITGYVLRVTP
jgi:hypothetical protein